MAMKFDSPLYTVDRDMIAARVKHLEAAGFSGCVSYDASHEPFIPLALATILAPNLDIQTGVAIAFGRTPLLVAQSAWTLQKLSGGKFLLGLGSQIKPHIERRFSMPWSKPTARMKEFVLAMHAIFDSYGGKPLRFEGEFYRHTLMPAPMNPGPVPFGPPPIILAAVGAPMLKIAGAVADGLVVHPFTTEAFLRDVTLPTVNAARAEAGRSDNKFAIHIQAMIACGRDEKELAGARAMIRNHIGFYASTPAYKVVLEKAGLGDLQPQLQQMTREGKWGEMMNLIPETLVDQVAAVGNPDDVAATLHRRYGQLADRILLASTVPMNPEIETAIIAAYRKREAS